MILLNAFPIFRILTHSNKTIHEKTNASCSYHCRITNR